MNSPWKDRFPKDFQPFCVFREIPVVGCFTVALLLPRVQADSIQGETWAKFRTSGMQRKPLLLQQQSPLSTTTSPEPKSPAA